MKTCNNCSAENHIAVEKCVQCNMKGNFSYQEMPTEAPQINEDIIQCQNCASDNPGDGIKCIQCHFPIQQHSKAKLAIMPISGKAKWSIR